MMLTDISPQPFGRNGRRVEWSRERMEQREKRVYGVPRCLSKGSHPLQEADMAERIETKAFVHQLALRMQTEDNVTAAWLEATVETLYENFKAGRGVTLTGFGGFYVQPRGETWAFKFNPGQKLRALFGWSSSYKGTL
jgi:nucleoid DNA-binding protein